MKTRKKTGVYIDAVFIPDQINPPNIDQWVTIDTLPKFIEYIENYVDIHKQLPDLISFGGCMTPQHELYMGKKLPGLPILYSTFKEPTGLGYAKWLTNFCKEKNIRLDCKLAVHEVFPYMAADIMYWITEYQEQEGIPITAFEFKFKKKRKDD